MILSNMPLLGVIPALGIISASMLIGIVNSVDKVYGKRYKFLEKIAEVVLGMSIGNIVGKLFWLFLTKKGIVTESNIWIGLTIGGLFIGIVGTIAGLFADKIGIEAAGRPAGMVTGLVAGGIVGWSYGEVAGGITGVIVGAIAGWVAGGSAGTGIAEAAGETFDDIAGAIACTISGLIAGTILGLFAGEFASSGLSMIGGVFVFAFLGTIAGVFVGLIVAPIARLLFVLLVKPFFILLTPALIILRHRKIICTSCFKYNKPFQSTYDHGNRGCRICKNVMSDEGIRQVIGLIGGDVNDCKKDGDKFYINLWDEKNKKSRNADIDILEIRNSNNINYGYAIASVITTLKNDLSRQRDYLKKIPVVLVSKPLIPADSIKNLEHNFKEILEKSVKI